MQDKKQQELDEREGPHARAVDRGADELLPVRYLLKELFDLVLAVARESQDVSHLLHTKVSEKAASLRTQERAQNHCT
jgi:hypothetical protein